jgi:anti-sigma-K factor RskA
MSRTHSEHEENVGAYLLGALTDLETTAFERHLAGCARCREEVERLRLVADALPRSVTPMEPPPSLKESLMQVVREEARAGQARAEAAPASERREGVELRSAASERGRAAGVLERILPRFPRVRPAIAWASAAVLLAVGAVTGYAVGELAGDDGRTVTAKVDKSRVPFASASLVVPEDQGKGAILRMHGLPELESNRVYQVWLRRGGAVIPQSLFEVGPDGSGNGAVTETLEDADAVLVTREAAGGARAPSEDPIVTVDL